MSVKKKGNFDMQRQRGLRGKTGIPLQRYDDSAYNNVIKKNFRSRPIKRTVSLNAEEVNNGK